MNEIDVSQIESLIYDTKFNCARISFKDGNKKVIRTNKKEIENLIAEGISVSKGKVAFKLQRVLVKGIIYPLAFFKFVQIIGTTICTGGDLESAIRIHVFNQSIVSEEIIEYRELAVQKLQELFPDIKINTDTTAALVISRDKLPLHDEDVMGTHNYFSNIELVLDKSLKSATHERIHRASVHGIYSGFWSVFNEKYTGINEAFTSYLELLVNGDTSGYNSWKYIEKLVHIIDINRLAQIYFDGTPTELDEELAKYTKKDLVGAIQQAQNVKVSNDETYETHKKAEKEVESILYEMFLVKKEQFIEQIKEENWPDDLTSARVEEVNDYYRTYHLFYNSISLANEEFNVKGEDLVIKHFFEEQQIFEKIIPGLSQQENSYFSPQNNVYKLMTLLNSTANISSHSYSILQKYLKDIDIKLDELVDDIMDNYLSNLLYCQEHDMLNENIKEDLNNIIVALDSFEFDAPKDDLVNSLSAFTDDFSTFKKP